MRPSRYLLLGGLAAAAAGGLPAAPAGQVPAVDRLAADLSFLADDALQGRDTASAEYEIAARYVASRFRAMGLAPAGEDGGYLQPVPLVRSRLVPGSAEVEILAGERREALAWAEDFVMGPDPVREATEILAPVTFAGFGVRAPELGYDDYAGLDVGDKLVLVFSGAPPTFPPDERAHYSSLRTKRAEAVRRGAVGMLVMRTAEDARRVPWERATRNAGRPGMEWIAADGTVTDFHPELEAMASLGDGAAARLLAASGHRLEELRAAATAGELGGFDLPVAVRLAARSEHDRLESSNVVALLPGSDPALRDEVVVYSAHLDHVGVGAPEGGDAIYNGAYDNAMGVAVMLEIARRFVALDRSPRRSVVFLAVTGEEHGLLGSDYFARHRPPAVGRLVADLNLDMPLFLHPLAELVAFGAEHSSLGEVASRAAAAEGLTLGPDPMPEEVIFIRSDQYSFVRCGVPSLFLVAGPGSRDPQVDGLAVMQGFMRNHYHMPSDDLSLPIDWDSALRFTQASVGLGLEVANADLQPRWRAGDFFGELFAGGC